MKRVLDCTRCKYFISCEPGKLAFATYNGCKEYEENESNKKRGLNMESIGVLRNTIAQLKAEAEKEDKKAFSVVLSPGDARNIIKSLEMLKEHEECKMGEFCTFTMGAVKSPYKYTVKGMLSEDYKERFKAEYQQTKIRYEKLKAFCNRIEAAMMTSHEGKKVDMPAHDCPYELLRTQQGHMGLYLHDLEIRAVIEGIEL